MERSKPEQGGRGRTSVWLKLAVAILLIGGLVAGIRMFDIGAAMRGVLSWVDAQGAAGPVFFVGAYVLATVLFVPGTVLTLGAGVVFGVVMGTVYVSIGSTLGASAAFLLGRYMMRDAVAGWIEGKRRFEAIDEAVASEGWKIVGLVRLSPIFPFNLLNYAFGLTRVSFWSYLIASWLGMIPGTILYVYLGSAAGSLARVGGEETPGTPAQRAFFYIGLAATAAVTVYVTHVARKALRTRLQVEEEAPPATD